MTRNLVTACEDGHNRAAREAMLLGATLAGMAFANSPVTDAEPSHVSRLLLEYGVAPRVANWLTAGGDPVQR